MKIYLLRHGETDWNKDRKMSCGDKPKLNEVGVEQAKEAAGLLENVHYDLVISSPYTRAKMTGEIANNNKAHIIIDDRLREINAGVLGGKSYEEIDFNEFFDYHKNIQYEGAESMKDFCKRVWDFLDEIKEKYKDKKVLLSTHGIVVKAIEAYVIGIPADGNLSAYKTKNGQIKEYVLI
ncbi:MAG: histidine phosphatase family protein [Oscillospiraceae bacterium]|nr:histidine phosphatase family protein [Oscillospiraceae bacterium]